MRRNRFKSQPNRDGAPSISVAAMLGRALWRGARPILGVALILGALGGIGLAGWKAVLRSPYFLVRQIEAEGSAHLTRDEVIQRVGLDAPVNVFRFEVAAAEDALRAHPWVATAEVSKGLPGRVTIRFEERKPEGVAVLGALYLVDGTGEPFAQPTPAEAAGLPLVTGLDRAAYEADPRRGHERIRDALAVARLYRQSNLAARRPLSDVHLGEGGRTELVVGRTRVVLGHDRFKQKLDQLERIFDQLDRRKADASYILMSSDDRRAIVKEIPLPEEGNGLSLRVAPEPPAKEGAN